MVPGVRDEESFEEATERLQVIRKLVSKTFAEL